MSRIKEFLIESKIHGTHKVLIDEEDWERVSQYKWNLSRNVRNKHKEVYYIASSGYNAIEKLKRGIKLHRYIVDCPEGKVVDHINGDTLDNRKENLRITTRQQNKWNRGKQLHSKNRYIGVFRPRGRGKWHAKIGHGRSKHRYIGSYNTEEEAAIARDKEVVRAREIVSPERQLNFPNRLEEYKGDNK